MKDLHLQLGLVFPKSADGRFGGQYYPYELVEWTPECNPKDCLLKGRFYWENDNRICYNTINSSPTAKYHNFEAATPENNKQTARESKYNGANTPSTEIYQEVVDHGDITTKKNDDIQISRDKATASRKKI